MVGLSARSTAFPPCSSLERAPFVELDGQLHKEVRYEGIHHRSSSFAHE
jgi:hypothetical protein